MEPEVINFGGEVRFRPGLLLAPRSEYELIALLQDNNDQCVRVMGSRHAWNEGIKSDDLLLDLRHLDSVRLTEESDQRFVVVGGGCCIKRLLAELNKHGLTIPSIGLITAQTIAGATATGTHGSGKHSLSHYIQRVRLVCKSNGETVIREVKEGKELLAARCSMGCLGIVTEVSLLVIPQYQIEEDTIPCSNLEEALSHESEWPLQQLYLLPHRWRWYAQRRRVSSEKKRSKSASLYHFYWFVGLNLGFVTLLKLLTVLPGKASLLRFFFRQIAPRFLITGWRVTDRSDRLLTMKHELIRHTEMEIFVRKDLVHSAVSFVVDILSGAAERQHALSEQASEALKRFGMDGDFARLRGTYTHNCPICIRRVLPDDTLISMTAGDEQWYAISLITYAPRHKDFFEVMEFLAKSTFKAFGTRIHWGKWFPLDGSVVAEQYEDLARFRDICQQFDPAGQFRNEFVARKMGFAENSGENQLPRESDE